MTVSDRGRLLGRIALVTGATKGIGRAVAKRLAAEGATVVAVGRSQADLESLDDQIKQETGSNAVLVDNDLTDFAVIDQIGQALYERYQRLDVLVGAAGTLGQLSPVGHVPPEVWEQVFALNVTANYRLLRSMDMLLRQSAAGRALFVTCNQGSKPSPFWGPYAASKAALEQLVQTYAAEMAETKVKANLIDPGPVRTALRLQAFPGEDQSKLPAPEDVTGRFVEIAGADYGKTGQRITL